MDKNKHEIKKNKSHETNRLKLLYFCAFHHKIFAMPYLMNPPTLERLLGIILNSFDKKGEIFDIPEKLFYKHWHNPALYTSKFGQELHNPIGLSSGPLTQLAQNIVSGWLCGARIIELKTVQPNGFDEIQRPSINIQDVAYNCEKSHELSIEQAYDQFLNAWIIIHLLNHKIFGATQKSKNIGTIFNMSLGYTLADIRSERMQWFVDKMLDCSVEKTGKIKHIQNIYPEFKGIDIPNQISNNFTISSYKGSSARELEYICKFLMIDKKLHPTIKFDPTLMGFGSVQAILSAENSFEVELNQVDFEDNIQYAEAVTLIENITRTAEEMNLELMVKLSNSLICNNNTLQIPKKSSKVYLSGRALHPIAVNLAAKLQSKFEGSLDISFSGGADCYNISNLIQSGFSLITVSTDLLKPGGYGRLSQYFQELMRIFANYQAKNIREFILKSGTEYGVKESALESLRNYAIRTLTDPAFQQNEISGLTIKSDRKLEHYDCISSPCTDACATHPDIAGYCWHTTKNDADKAINSILAVNPLPSVSGMISNEPSRLICTRMSYDYPVLMRDIERFIAEYEPGESMGLPGLKKIKKDVAVIGGGVSGLACAWYLNKYGFTVDIYEAEKDAGGVARKVVPEFRLSDSALFKDIQRIKNAGIKILTSTEIDKERFARIQKTYQYVYVATGVSEAEKLKIDGEDANGVIDPVIFLSEAKINKKYIPGKNIAIIGNNWMAADAARTAKRLLGEENAVTLICDGSIDDMEIDINSRAALIDEGIEIFEYSIPKKILTNQEHVAGLELIETEVYDQEGNKQPIIKELEGTEQIFEFDTVIPCTGRKPKTGFVDIRKLKNNKDSRATKLDHVYAGGTLLNPSASFMDVVADAKLAAHEIAINAGIEIPENLFKQTKSIDIQKLKIQKSHREKPNRPEKIPSDQRNNFDTVIKTLKPVKALKEAARCLQCDTLCNVCLSVCPNKAMVGFEIEPEKLKFPVVTFNKEDFRVTLSNKFGIKQKYQIINIADWCNQCGNCTTFCPTSGAPYKDKLRVHFNREAFNKDTEGFLLTRLDNNSYVITMKKDGNLVTLTENWDALIFENDDCMAVLNKETFAIEQIDNFTDKNILELPEILEIKIIYRVVKYYI